MLICSPVNVLARLQCIKFDTVFFTSRCIIPLANCCNSGFVGVFEQHLSVLGPCLMALDLHPRMLGKVYFGTFYSYCLFLASAVAVVIGSFLR